MGAQKAVADATGYDRAHVNRVLAGQRRAGLDFQETIASHYGMSLGEFLRMGESILAGDTKVVFCREVRTGYAVKTVNTIVLNPNLPAVEMLRVLGRLLRRIRQ